MFPTAHRAWILIVGVGITASVALAHGDHAPKYGGLVKVTGETIVELVSAAEGARIYLRDDAEEAPMAASGGKLITLLDGVRTEVKLVSDGKSALLAKGAKLAPGTRVAVLVLLADGKTRVAANFAIP